MRTQNIAAVSGPFEVTEVEVSVGDPASFYRVRREPHPDAPADFCRAWITEVWLHRVTAGPGLSDIHDSRVVDVIDDDDGGPLEAVAAAWAERVNLERWAS